MKLSTNVFNLVLLLIIIILLQMAQQVQIAVEVIRPLMMICGRMVKEGKK